jgi:hypothetical protein
MQWRLGSRIRKTLHALSDHRPRTCQGDEHEYRLLTEALLARLRGSDAHVEDESGRCTLEQLARELTAEIVCADDRIPEFGFGATCHQCGQRNLDEKTYADCTAVRNLSADGGEGWFLLCNACAGR